VTAAIRNGSNPPVRDLYDRLKERGKHQKVAEVACMRKLLAIVYGRKGNNERFDPTYEKRLKARQVEKKSTGEASGDKRWLEWAEKMSSQSLPRTTRIYRISRISPSSRWLSCGLRSRRIFWRKDCRSGRYT